jgi:hypothetical protein
MPLRDVYRCNSCNGTDVRYDAWYDPNQDDTQVFDDGFCMDCEGECTIIKTQEGVPEGEFPQ